MLQNDHSQKPLSYFWAMKHLDDDIRELLEQKFHQYNHSGFIQDDPVSVPHAFTEKEDIEIAGFLAATIAWGQRPVIIRNAQLLMQWMDYSPSDFIRHAGDADMRHFSSFRHRTFNGDDCIIFIRALQRMYREEGGLEGVFTACWNEHAGDAGRAISGFREMFFSGMEAGRTGKHVADPLKGSSAKRINMFLRWMVRADHAGVDFGIWKGISPAGLCCPLDVHTGRVARKLGILERKTDDWTAVVELTGALKTIDPLDPVRFDFALFGLGMYEGF